MTKTNKVNLLGNFLGVVLTVPVLLIGGLAGMNVLMALGLILTLKVSVSFITYVYDETLRPIIGMLMPRMIAPMQIAISLLGLVLMGFPSFIIQLAMPFLIAHYFSLLHHYAHTKNGFFYLPFLLSDALFNFVCIVGAILALSNIFPVLSISLLTYLASSMFIPFAIAGIIAYRIIMTPSPTPQLPSLEGKLENASKENLEPKSKKNLAPLVRNNQNLILDKDDPENHLTENHLKSLD